MWSCITASRNDRILVADVDTALRPEALRGVDLVGTDRQALVSLTKNTLHRTPAQMWRHMLYRRRVRRSDMPFSGTFWVWRPFLLQAPQFVDFYRSISNGFDSAILHTAQQDDTWRVTCLKDMGSNCMDIENEDQPWRQFMVGIYLYVDADRQRRRRVRRAAHSAQWTEAYTETVGLDGRKVQRTAQRPPQSRIHAAALRVRARLRTSRLWQLYALKIPLQYSVEYAYPWTLRGWMWAARNPTHPAVTSARHMSYMSWTMVATPDVKRIRDWAAVGRTGTGFG